jgi:N-methylhydantoinase A
MAQWMVGIDIGGTFTDVAAMEIDSRELRITKVPSVPADPARAVMEGLGQLAAERGGVRAQDIRFFAHGTTVATNALLEMKGARAGLLLTRGCRGVYEVRGGTRPVGSDLIDTFYPKPPLLVSQKYTDEIEERLAYDGSVVTPLDEDSVRRAVRRLRDRGVQSIAVCYLFSFMNPAHEERTAELIREEHPGCRVSRSSVVLPVIREYKRISTTLLDAYVGPVVEGYLRRLSGRLREAGAGTEQLYIMQSNGGLMRIDVASSYPNQTLLSGPAAGVVFGAALGELVGESNLITFDMGGTSTDISTVVDGSYAETREGKISGQDIGSPMIEIRTLGAGGGTIAWIGPDGLLKAGPQSAGADPGPACYGHGSMEATVTDANLVLGYLDPATFIGGRMQIEPGLAERAIREKVAGPLGLGLEEAALGIVRVVNVNMEVGLRLSLVERGLDPRKFALVAFGGSGPVHAGRVARNVGIPRVIVPPHPGISCAMGLMQTDVKHYYLQSRFASLLSVPLPELNRIFASLEEKALAEAKLEGFEPREVQLTRQLDLRYPYQGYELTIACPGRPIEEADRPSLRRVFDQLHQQVYGTSAPDETPEVVNVRVASVARIQKLGFEARPRSGESAAAAQIGERPVFFEETGKYVPTRIFRRDALGAGNRIEGPAVIEQLDSTTVIYPGQRAQVDRFGNLVIEVEAAGGA